MAMTLRRSHPRDCSWKIVSTSSYSGALSFCNDFHHSHHPRPHLHSHTRIFVHEKHVIVVVAQACKTVCPQRLWQWILRGSSHILCTVHLRVCGRLSALVLGAVVRNKLYVELWSSVVLKDDVASTQPSRHRMQPVHVIIS